MCLVPRFTRTERESNARRHRSSRACRLGHHGHPRGAAAGTKRTAGAKRGRESWTRLLGERDEVGHGHALLLVDLVARRREAEGVDALDLVGVLVPDDGDARLDGGGLRLHRSGEEKGMTV